MDIKETLNERQGTHGDFTDNARVSQELKQLLHSNLSDRNNVQQEAIDMICHKLSRIVCGNAYEPDHWRDIAGYATLVVERLEK